MNIRDILNAVQTQLEAYFTNNNIEAIITLFPDDVDITDDEKLYVYLDVGAIRYSRYTTNDYVVSYELKVGLAQISDNYEAFILNTNQIQKDIAELLMTNMLISAVSVEEFSYDKTNAVGYCVLVATVGVSA